MAAGKGIGFLLLLIASCSTAAAQDRLELRSGKVLAGRVLSIGPDEVKVKIAEITVSLPRSTIRSIDLGPKSKERSVEGFQVDYEEAVRGGENARDSRRPAAVARELAPATSNSGEEISGAAAGGEFSSAAGEEPAEGSGAGAPNKGEEAGVDGALTKLFRSLLWFDLENSNALIAVGSALFILLMLITFVACRISDFEEYSGARVFGFTAIVFALFLLEVALLPGDSTLYAFASLFDLVLWFLCVRWFFHESWFKGSVLLVSYSFVLLLAVLWAEVALMMIQPAQA